MADTLCLSCKNSTAMMCKFMDIKSENIEEVISSMSLDVLRKLSYADKNRKYTVYVVTNCPNYEPGEIPPIGEMKPGKRRLTNTSVNIVPKEDKQLRKTRYEIAKEKMTRELYLQLKSEGKRDAKIASEFDIAIDVFYKLKKEYESLADQEQNTEVTGQDTAGQDAEITDQDAECNADADSVTNDTENVTNDADSVTQDSDSVIRDTQTVNHEPIWINKNSYDQLTCKIGKDLRLNVASRNNLENIEYIRIGVLNNRLIIAPCQEGESGCYKLNKEKHSAGIGGNRLLYQLKKLGIGEGRYLLTKNEQGWLVGELMSE
jgi:hypothetical protein